MAHLLLHMKKASMTLLAEALDWSYEVAVSGGPSVHGAKTLAEKCIKKAGAREAAIDVLISRQIRKAGLAGFVTGLGGIITVPISIPTNLATVLFIQTRMIAAIAHMRGFDIQSGQVKPLVFGCMTGLKSVDLLRA